MRRLIDAVAFCLLTLPAVCKSTSKYQVVIITDVKAHQVAGDAAASDNSNYDVSVRVGDTIPVVLYTPRLGELPAKYATGRELLVPVEKDAITYNDMLGRSLQVAIESQRPASEPKQAK